MRTLSGLGADRPTRLSSPPPPDCPLQIPAEAQRQTWLRLRLPSARLLIVSMSVPFTPIRRLLQYCRPLP